MTVRIDPDVRRRLDDAVRRRDQYEIDGIVRTMQPEELEALFHELGDEYLAEVASELEPGVAARLLMRLHRPDAADVLEELPPEEAADIVGALSPEARDTVLAQMQGPEAANIRELLAYPAHSTGGRMTTRFLAIREGMTVDEALRALREEAGRAEAQSYVYVLDDRQRLAGVAPVHELVVSRADRPIRDITKRDVITVRATDDQELAARRLQENHLLALPVVDADDRMVGIVTAADMAQVIEEEASEDIERLGGSQPLEEPYLSASIWHLFRKRILWLLALFAAEAYTGSVLRSFQGELEAVVALAFFIPLLIGTGGNTGSQTVTMLVRAMALGEVKMRDLGRILSREVAVGLLLGIVMGAAAWARAWTLGVPELGVVVAVTALCVVVWAALVAAVLPLVLKALRVDPAVVSAPLITTLVDGTGLIIYFNVAKIVLKL